MVTLTATFVASNSAANKHDLSVSSFLESGSPALSVLDTKSMGSDHCCHIYRHQNGTASSVQLTFESIIGGDSAVVLVQHIDGAEPIEMNCGDTAFYPDLNRSGSVEDDDIRTLFGPRGVTTFDGVSPGDYLYVNIYPLSSYEELRAIDSDDGYCSSLKVQHFRACFLS